MLRPGTIADAPAIARVHVRSWRRGYRGIVADSVLEALSVEEYERNWIDWLSRGESRTVVAIADEVLAGFATTMIPGRDEAQGAASCELAALYVDPDHWRRGIGAALMRETMESARADACVEMTAWVLARNAAALAFYERLGFAPDGARQRHNRSGRTAIRVRAPL